MTYTGCHTGGSSITGVAFYQGGSYPATYNGALFFGDHSRNEIWAMLPGTNGLPDPTRLQSFVGVDAAGGAAGHPVDLKTGPGGDLFYVDMDDGTVHRITYTAANQPPTAVITANPTNGPAPLTVSFDGTGSSDPEGKPLSYSWDLNGDGTFGDATGPTASYTYTTAGVYHPSLRVTDDQGATDTTSVTVTRGQHRADRGHRLPRVEPDLEGRRHDQLLRPCHRCAGRHAAGIGAELVADHASLLHCHRLPHAPDPDPQGVASGSFAAPDHEYPCWLELQLTATDSGGLTSTTSVRLDPKTVLLTFKTNPGGLSLSDLVVNEAPRTTPFSVTVVAGSANSVSAPSPQQFNKSTYNWTSWSDGGPQSHTITAPAVNTTYTAIYRKR